MNTIVYFEIQSSDPVREMKFYETLFGWKFSRELAVPVEYYRIETGGMHGGLLKSPAAVPPAETCTNAFTCSIAVENFDQVSELIQEIDVKVVMPKFAVPGKCWQGYFIDADKNTFGIFEVDENAQ